MSAVLHITPPRGPPCPYPAWEGDLDRTKAQRVLEGDELVDVTAG